MEFMWRGEEIVFVPLSLMTFILKNNLFCLFDFEGQYIPWCPGSLYSGVNSSDNGAPYGISGIQSRLDISKANCTISLVQIELKWS